MNGIVVGVIIFAIVLAAIAAWAYLRLRALHLTTAAAVKADLNEHVQVLVNRLHQAADNARGNLLAGVALAAGGGTSAAPAAAPAPSTPTDHAEAAASAVADAVQAAALAAAADASSKLQAAATAVAPPAPAAS